MTSSVFQKRFYIYLKKTPNLRKKNFEKNVWLGNENCYSCRWVWTVKISIFKTSRKLKNMYRPQIRLLCAKRQRGKESKWNLLPHQKKCCFYSCVYYFWVTMTSEKESNILITILCVLNKIFERQSSNTRLLYNHIFSMFNNIITVPFNFFQSLYQQKLPYLQ